MARFMVLFGVGGGGVGGVGGVVEVGGVGGVGRGGRLMREAFRNCVPRPVMIGD